MAITKEGVHCISVCLAYYDPEAKAANFGTYGSANERKRLRSFGLEYGETGIASDTEVGFEHGKVIAHIGTGIQSLKTRRSVLMGTVSPIR